MAFAEDLTVFFDTDDFAVAATIKNASNVTVRTANVIFSDPNREVLMDDGAVAPSGPAAICRSADVSDVRDGWKFVISGTTYRVSGVPANDGTGCSTVQLKP